MTPKEFYHTQKWKKLIALLKQERTKDGQLICEHCGLPIVRSYDCIGHHKIELTEDNVEDFNISLNPDNIELIHFKCHNIIHERFEGNKQKVFLVYGSPCSGKTTWVNEVANDDDLILDVDRIWDAISNGGRYAKPPRLNSNVFNLRDTIIEQIKTRTGRWRNAYILTTECIPIANARLCEMVDAELIHIDTDKKTCLSNLYTNGDGRDLDKWEKYINNYFDKYELYCL